MPLAGRDKFRAKLLATVLQPPDQIVCKTSAHHNLEVRPRVVYKANELTRYHGVFAPASFDRARIVPGTRTAASAARGEVSVSDRQRAMSWAHRLKRVFAIDIDKSAGLPICTTEGRRDAVGHRDVPDETCRQCGGRLRVIASIEQPEVIERILDHLGHTAEPVDPAHSSRAPPQGDRLL